MNALERIIFLISTPRSGSTLLAHLLSAHPKVHSKGETWLMLALNQIGNLPAYHPYGNWHVATATRDFLKEAGNDAIPAVAKTLYSMALPEKKTVFLDKTPRYYWISDWLYSQFPDAHFIVLQRNPLDVAASMKTTWQDKIDYGTIFSNQSSTVFDLMFGPEKVAGFAKKHEHDPRVHVVQYEDVVRDPASECARLLKALKLNEGEFSEDWLKIEPERLALNFGDPKIHQTEKVHSDSLGSAKQVLTEDEFAFLSAYHRRDDLPPEDPWADKVLLARKRVEMQLRERQLMETAFLSPGAHNQAADEIAHSIFKQVANIPDISGAMPQLAVGSGTLGPWPPISVGEVINMASDVRLAGCLGEGWHSLESDAVWSSRARSFLTLRLDGDVRQINVKISDGIASWRPDASFWARLVGQEPFSEREVFALGREPVWKSIPLKNNSGVVHVEIGCSDLFNPAQRGFEPPEERDLGVYLHAISAD